MVTEPHKSTISLPSTIVGCSVHISSTMTSHARSLTWPLIEACVLRLRPISCDGEKNNTVPIHASTCGCFLTRRLCQSPSVADQRALLLPYVHGQSLLSNVVEEQQHLCGHTKALLHEHHVVVFNNDFLVHSTSCLFHCCTCSWRAKIQWLRRRSYAAMALSSYKATEQRCCQ